MAVTFDKWSALKLLEVGFVIACLIAKRITDDEASRLFLYLQKLSREWSLLNNVTWDRVGAAVADATYGGYIIITTGLFFGRLFGELPTKRRISEYVLLGIGILLFVVLGGLEFAALDSVPPDLVDNAAVLGSLSLITALLFIIDLAGPRAKGPKNDDERQKKSSKQNEEAKDLSKVKVEKDSKGDAETQTQEKTGVPVYSYTHNVNEDHLNQKMNGLKQNSYHRLKEHPLETNFDIFGKDKSKENDFEKDTQVDEVISQIVKHEPVWSKVRKGQYGKRDVMPYYYYPSPGSQENQKQSTKPGEPGYVQHAAQHWEHTISKPPTEV